MARSSRHFSWTKRQTARHHSCFGSCVTVDAVWFTSIFDGKDVSAKDEARKVFLLYQDDARALCFAWCLSDWLEQQNVPLLGRASEMGYAFACSTHFERVVLSNRTLAFRLAQLSAAQHERDGFYWLGRCFRKGLFCDRDLSSAKENCLIAAELGHIQAADAYGRLLGEADSACWLWFGRVALRGLPHSFFFLFC